MISGPSHETSYTAITLNQGSNFTRREKNHSLFHWNTLTYPELLIRIWMLCKEAASMTIGISIDQDVCPILGQVSLNVLYWKKNLQTDICGPRGRLTRKQLTSRPDHLWPELWEMKNSILITHENCEGSISSTLRTRNLRRPSRMLVRNWKHQWLPLCLARQARKVSSSWPT